MLARHALAEKGGSLDTPTGKRIVGNLHFSGTRALNNSLDTAGTGFDPTLQSVVEAMKARIESRPGPVGKAFLLQPETETVRGWYNGLTIRPGFSLVLSDLRYAEQCVYHHECGEYLKLHFKLDGTSVIGSEQEEDVPVLPGLMSFLVQPTDSVKYERIVGESHERSITMICSKDFVSGLLSPGTPDLPASIADFLRARASHFTYDSLPMHPQMRPIVEDILSPPDTGALGNLMMEAKALELLCFAIKQILGSSRTTETVRPRDRRKIEELCRILGDDTQASYSIADLCRHLAWNETQMMECFKQVTGTTISTYRQRVRMDNARRQLCDTDASITEVAFNAGYEHPSNFATAFKRTFGYSPRLARARLN
ncbi:helix-turn-helix transcriptional regulator [Sphingosinicella soli]|uniref:AraC-like DNA-binding protein n=1 Tax=Sphingosinicella soli TaxID=333708 RepID=A0A7W7AZX7_9SPHN|nr:AraC family transcriptional regulator [Sphingosinicella soli]MBB4631449.1 AraC-like DNA-binding protein [Sphingosinicella soli]